MELSHIHAFSKCRYARHFLTKSYSIELLLFLLAYKKAEGIEELLLDLKSTTPKLPAFLSYIALLEAKGCVTKTETETKRSKRTITLTHECEIAVRGHLLKA